jgi:radical SAM protein with 4Fe4S-binding SPASM domain
MRSSLSDEQVFCPEPWTGRFSIKTNGDVTFCPCYLQLTIGNVGEASMREIWNSETMIGLRADFREGKLPRLCEDQLCPVAVSHRARSSGKP